MFDSSKTFGLFTGCFDEELYHYAANFYENNTFGRDSPLYAIVGITKVLENVAITQLNHSSYQDVKRFLEQNFVTISSSNKLNDKFRPFLTARIDIRLITKIEEGELKLLFLSDDKAEQISSKTLKENTILQIHSYAGNLKLVTKSSVEGQIYLYLRGLDVRDIKDNSKRIPYWIDYTKLTVNDKKIFDTLTPTWCGQPYVYSMDVKAGDEIAVQVEWLPHRSDT